MPIKVVLVPSGWPADGASAQMPRLQYLTSFLINDTLAIDAGSIGFYGSPEEQARIKHVLISHTHMDHVASLPILVENAYAASAECVTIHGGAPSLRSIRHDFFNNRVWPDFINLSTDSAPFLALEELEPGRSTWLEGLFITPVMVDHVVPTLGFVIQAEDASVVIVGDTGPTEEIWRVARATPNLKAVFLEACFPNDMTWLAEVSKHLTPAMFAAEAAKLDPSVRLLAVHLKARYAEQVFRELAELRLPNMEIVEPGRTYQF